MYFRKPSTYAHVHIIMEYGYAPLAPLASFH